MRLITFFLASLMLFAQESPRSAGGGGSARGQHWAVLLEEPPLAEQADSRDELRSAWANSARLRIQSEQSRIVERLAQRKIRSYGSVQTLLNAVFIVASEEQANALRGMSGVRSVVEMAPLRRTVNKAGELVNAPQAWAALGGVQSAGAGVKIGILDTGLDAQHPAFQDNSLAIPPGYPKCTQSLGECDYTSRKIIAARSYVNMLVEGDFPEFSRPDDLSPRDRVGHGTGVALIAAGAPSDSPVGRINGIAPKAYLGNYKVFGSPGVNDVTFNSVLIKALEDAFNDGMDIVTLSLGFPATWGPLDEGVTCNEAGGVACDPRARALENAVARGLTVVVAAGNEGDSGQYAPTLASVTSPGTAPSAITVGATTNSHRLFQAVRVTGAGVPSNLLRVNGLFGDGPRPAAAITAPLKDVSKLGDNGQACQALGNGTLAGAFALIQANGCSLRTKVTNAQKSGARGVVFMRGAGNEFVFSPTGLPYSGIPLILVGNKDGKALQDFLAANVDRPVTLDPALQEFDATIDADVVAYFSSYGPSIRSNAIKPELVAPGTDMLTGTQKLDPNGDMYDATGYTVVQGTSFSVPVVAGTAALVKQRHPGYSPLQIKSALVNTATDNIDDVDNTGSFVKASVTAVGAGKVNAQQAIQSNITVNPTTISFGASGSASWLPQSLVFQNLSSAPVTLRLTAVPSGKTNGNLTFSATSFTLAAGATSVPVSVNVSGASATPGIYEGAVTVEGGAVPLRIPYLYIERDGVAANLIPLRNYNFAGVMNTRLAGGFLFKAIDRFGVPVPSAPVSWSVLTGGGSYVSTFPTTDDLGIAEAGNVQLGPSLGTQGFAATLGNLPRLEFLGDVRMQPAITNGGVLNAASGTLGEGLAPGSYLSIYGRGLSDIFLAFSTPYLPLSLAGVSVSFDDPGRGISVPGRIHFVSDGQVNVQIPWELAGLPSVQMKVSIGDASSAVYTLKLSNYSPAAFEYDDATSGRRLAVAQKAGETAAISGANPAVRGRVIVLYANGLGPVSNQPASGEVSPSNPLARTPSPASVTIGGAVAEVSFTGMTPSTVGLYQINVRVPDGAGTGLQPVVITMNGISSKPANLPIQ